MDGEGVSSLLGVVVALTSTEDSSILCAALQVLSSSMRSLPLETLQVVVQASPEMLSLRQTGRHAGFNVKWSWFRRCSKDVETMTSALNFQRSSAIAIKTLRTRNSPFASAFRLDPCELLGSIVMDAIRVVRTLTGASSRQFWMLAESIIDIVADLLAMYPVSTIDPDGREIRSMCTSEKQFGEFILYNVSQNSVGSP